MKIKKQRLIIAIFAIITLLLISPISVNAESCTLKCSGTTTTAAACITCCNKFDSNGIGISNFSEDDFKNVFGKDCDKYIENYEKTKKVTGSNAIDYCISKCSGKSGTAYNSCYNSCCKEKGCSTKEASTTTTKNTTNVTNTNSDNNNTINTCEGILGDKTNDKTVAWLIDKILSYLKILGPLLIVVLSSVDFAKTIIMSDEENMKKAQKKLITRLLAAVLLFFVPTLVQLLLDIFGITSCNIY